MYQETKTFLWLASLLYFSDLNPNPEYLRGVPASWNVIIYHGLPDGIWNFFSDSTKYRMLLCFIWQCKFKPKVSSTLAPDTPLWKQETKENAVFGSSKAGLDPKKLIFKGKEKLLRRMGIHFRERQNLIRFCILFKILNILSSNKSTLWEHKYLLPPRFWGVREHSQINIPPIRQLKASLVAQLVKNRPAMQETPVRFLGREDPLKKGMATHFSILAWRVPWTEEPGGLQSMGSQSWTQPRDFHFIWKQAGGTQTSLCRQAFYWIEEKNPVLKRHWVDGKAKEMSISKIKVYF